MPWPFRRNRGDRDVGRAETAAPTENEAQTQPSDTLAGGAPAGAWRDLPDPMATLGRMPETLDTAFSRTLPTRWHVPPALAPLGHDVRPDVFGGLVSDVARTVQPRGTDPADLVWRAGGGTRARVVTRLAPTAYPGLPSTVANTVTNTPTSTATNASTSTAPSVDSGPDAQLPSSDSAEASEPGAEQAQTAVVADSPSLPDVVTPSWVSQTRRALPAVAIAVEARVPRPVPADVTDGATAASPDVGTDFRTEAGAQGSPPSSSAPFGPPPASEPREAGPGRDPQGSAPATVPAVPTPAPVPTTPTAPTTPSSPTASAAPNTPTAPTLSPSPTMPTASSGAPAPYTQRADSGSAAGAPPADQATASTDVPVMSSPETVAAEEGPDNTPAADGDSAALLNRLTSFAAAPDSTAANPTAAAPTFAADTPAASAASASTADMKSAIPYSAPLVSMTNITRSATTINRLLPPSRPVGQPVAEQERIVGGFASAAASAAAPSVPALGSFPSAPAGGLPTGPTRALPISPASPSSPFAQPPTTPLSQSTDFDDPPPSALPTSLRSPASRSIAAAAITAADAASGAVSTLTNPNPPPDPSAAPASAPSAGSADSGSGPASAPDYPSDPAALDLLARRLYGRFSRRLADELLAERERAQFLTDLA